MTPEYEDSLNPEAFDAAAAGALASWRAGSGKPILKLIYVTINAPVQLR